MSNRAGRSKRAKASAHRAQTAKRAENQRAVEQAPSPKPAAKEALALFKLKYLLKRLFGRSTSNAEAKPELNSFISSKSAITGIASNLRSIADTQKERVDAGKKPKDLGLAKLSTMDLYRVRKNISGKKQDLESHYTEQLKYTSDAERDSILTQIDILDAMEVEIDQLLEARINGYRPPTGPQSKNSISAFMSSGTDLGSALENLVSIGEAIRKTPENSQKIDLKSLSTIDLHRISRNIRELKKQGIERVYEELLLTPEFDIESPAQNTFLRQINIFRKISTQTQQLLKERGIETSDPEPTSKGPISPECKRYIAKLRDLGFEIDRGREKPLIIDHQSSIGLIGAEALGAQANDPRGAAKTTVEIPISGTDRTVSVSAQFITDISRNDLFLMNESKGEEIPLAILEDSSTDIAKPEGTAGSHENSSPEGKKWIESRVLAMMLFCGYDTDQDSSSAHNQQVLRQVTEISTLWNQSLDGTFLEFQQKNPTTETNPMHANGRFFGLSPARAEESLAKYTLTKDTKGNLSVSVQRRRHSMQVLQYGITGVNIMDMDTLSGSDPKESNFVEFTVSATLGDDGKWVFPPEGNKYELHVEIPPREKLENPERG